MQNKVELKKLNVLLTVEEEFVESLKNTEVAKQLAGAQNNLLEHIRKVGHSGDLSLIVATEKTIIQGDLTRYANSQAMAGSLQTALNEIAAIERHIVIVDDKAKYQIINEGHSLPKHRKGGLPYDEARKALLSHYTRLNNMDKSRLGDEEKKVIDARKSAIFTAQKIYTEKQAKILGISLTKKHPIKI
jgi:hypothetical protein